MLSYTLYLELLKTYDVPDEGLRGEAHGPGASEATYSSKHRVKHRVSTEYGQFS